MEVHIKGSADVQSQFGVEQNLNIIVQVNSSKLVSGSAVVITVIQFRMNCDGCWFESRMRRTVARASKIRRYSKGCIKVQTKGKGGKKMRTTSMSIQKIGHNVRESLEQKIPH